MADRSATPAAERVHIAFFGRRNAGKSSLVNALTGQSVAIVSPVAGTTTDPVRKSMAVSYTHLKRAEEGFLHSGIAGGCGVDNCRRDRC